LLTIKLVNDIGAFWQKGGFRIQFINSKVVYFSVL